MPLLEAAGDDVLSPGSGHPTNCLKSALVRYVNAYVHWPAVCSPFGYSVAYNTVNVNEAPDLSGIKRRRVTETKLLDDSAPRRKVLAPTELD